MHAKRSQVMRELHRAGSTICIVTTTRASPGLFDGQIVEETQDAAAGSA